MQAKIFTIDSEYITLGQLLKALDIIQSGGMAKWYLSEYVVYVNQSPEDRRGRKLRDGDLIEFPNEELQVAIRKNVD